MTGGCRKAEQKPAEKPPPSSQVTTGQAPRIPAGMEELKLDLPMLGPIPTPFPPRTDEPVKPLPKTPFLVPVGCKNVALNKKVTSSDRDPIIGNLELVTDGVKEKTEGSFVELSFGEQWVQIDLEREYRVFAVVVWRIFGERLVYNDVIVQVSNDADFVEQTTVFNADHDNTSGLGAGSDFACEEGREGRIIDGKGARGRYVRLYSRGNSKNEQNHYTEVEVYALPAQ